MAIDPTQGFTVPGSNTPTPQRQFTTFDPFAWGGQGDDVDENGNPVAGTSGLARDVQRWQQMGQVGEQQQGPQISQAFPNQSRGVIMGGLANLAARSQGGQPSVAEQAGTAQAAASANNLQGTAGTVRGGAAARAAAANIANRQGAMVRARQVGVNAATRAEDMANARQDFVGATGALRGQDIGLATSQADLEAKQRQLNDQRENFFENQAQRAKDAQLGARLNRTAGAQAAATAGFQQNQQLQQQQQENTMRVVGAGSSTGAGLVDSYIQSHKYDSTSDPDAKENVTPMTHSPIGAKKNVRARVRDIIRQDPYTTQPVYDRSMFKSHGPGVPGDENTQKIQAGIERVLAAQAPAPGIVRENPYTARAMRDDPGSYEHGVAGAPKGYASMRVGRYGAIGGPEAPDTEFAPKDAAMAARDNSAPYHEGRDYDFTRQVALSDPDAKKQAFRMGAQYANTASAQGKAPEIPEYMKGSEFDPANTERAGHPRNQAPPKQGVRQLETHSPYDAASIGRHGEPVRYAQPVGPSVQMTGATNQYNRAAPPPAPPAPKRQTMPQAVAQGVAPLVAPAAAMGFSAATPFVTNSPIAAKRNIQSFHRDTPEEQREIAEANQKPVQTSGAGYMSEREERQKFYGISPTHSPIDAKQNIVDLDEPDASLYGSAGAPAFHERMPETVRDTPEDQARVKKQYLDKQGQEADEMMRALDSAAKTSSTPRREDIGEDTPDLSQAAAAQEQAAREPTLAGAMRAMKPYVYEYKEGFRQQEGQKPGEKNVGPMADQMARHPVASTVITIHPKTGMKAIDVKKGLKLALGSLSDLQRQIDELAEKKKRTA